MALVVAILATWPRSDTRPRLWLENGRGGGGFPILRAIVWMYQPPSPSSPPNKVESTCLDVARNKGMGCFIRLLRTTIELSTIPRAFTTVYVYTHTTFTRLYPILRLISNSSFIFLVPPSSIPLYSYICIWATVATTNITTLFFTSSSSIFYLCWLASMSGKGHRFTQLKTSDR